MTSSPSARVPGPYELPPLVAQLPDRVGELLPIGELSARSGISRSALRFYDECAVLRPVVVDEANGYRYYGPGQVTTAVLIRQLRDAGLGIEAIRTYLASDPSGRTAMLDGHLEQLEVRHASLLAAVQLLRSGACRANSSEDGEALPGAAVTLRGRLLAEALAQVLPAAAVAPPAERLGLAGVLVEVKDWSLRLVATDSYCLAIRDLVPERAFAPMRSLVPAARLAALLPSIAATGECSLAASASGALRLDLEGSVEIVEALEAAFPDYEQVLEGRPVGWRCLVGRDELAAAADDRPSGAPEATSTCRRKAGPIEGLSGDAEESASEARRALPFAFRAGQLRAGERVLDRSWDGPDLDLLLDAHFVAEALRSCDGPDVVIEASGALAPVTIRCADSGTFNVWIMPIRP